MLNLEDIDLFISVVELGGFTRASDFCMIPKSTISRRVRDLEAKLNTRLIERTTRKITLTVAGEKFYQEAKSLINQAKTLENETINEQSDIAGSVVIYAPIFVNELCATLIQKFCEWHKGIRLELLSSAQGEQQIYEKRFDILVSYGELPDSSLIAKTLAKLKFDYYVSPKYIETNGYPLSPVELNKFDIISHIGNASENTEWQFNQVNISITPRVKVDSLYMLLSLARAGQGICCLPKVIGVNEVNQGNLINLFDGAFEYEQTLFALYHSKRFLPQRVRSVLDYMADIIQPIIDDGENSVKEAL
jgi:DNA-binding transcriptional LysR family regulator